MELNRWRLLRNNADMLVCPYCLSDRISCNSCHLVKPDEFETDEHVGKIYYDFRCKDCGGVSFDINFDVPIHAEHVERLNKIRRGERVEVVKRDTIESYRISCSWNPEERDV